MHVYMFTQSSNLDTNGYVLGHTATATTHALDTFLRPGYADMDPGMRLCVRSRRCCLHWNQYRDLEAKTTHAQYANSVAIKHIIVMLPQA